MKVQPTDESKDIPNGGDKDDERIDPSQQNYCDDDVTDPAEFFRGA